MPLDPTHDPGFDSASRRARATGVERAAVANGKILVGTAGWTDPTLTAPGVFYPDDADDAEGRLRYYASRFPMVEVDSSYYAIPRPDVAAAWVRRTPGDFVFNLKAFALMTGQPTEVKRLPKDLREALPEEAASKKRIYAKDLPPELRDEVWARFRDAVEPLRAAGKLGAVLLQYPRWFTPTRANADAILDAKRRLHGLTCAVEFRNRRWLAPDSAERTMLFLEEHRLPFVMVDEPQGMESSVPPVVAVTSPDLAIVRFHGRRAETWETPNVSVTERFRYLYDHDELAEWVPKIEEAAATTRRVQAVFNNCYGNYGTTNALELAGMLGSGEG